ncbi:MAG: hypothetical protein FWF90_08035 [Promicromonosporaceae bacterium]|nr:hypothetical protein [Promicromonosporaceae bacterium]
MKRIIRGTLASILAVGMAFAIAPAAQADDRGAVTVFIEIGDFVLTRSAFTPLGDPNNLPDNARFGEIVVEYVARYDARLLVEHDGYLRNGLGVITARYAVHDLNNAPMGSGSSIPIAASSGGSFRLGTYLVGPSPQTQGRHTGTVTLVLDTAG